ncbi:hypothetical protein [Sphingomonas panni]|uniref:hypothetical protein n=1 Tax=Sphingomonas panni TaxID=237612 RepID=UPI001F5BEABD|nr:hypothetical protein [Sphingomonas panni]
MKTSLNAVGVALVATIAPTGPAVGQGATGAQRSAPARAGPSSMDVAGVRLGMPVADAQAALAGTYRCERPSRTASFRQLVDGEIERRRGGRRFFGPEGAAIDELACTGPSGEYMRLFMAQTAGGTVVDRIDLFIRTDRVDPTELVRQVERKYGRPTEGTAANGSWCVTRCGFDLTMEPKPRITVRSDASSFKIMGSRGREARLADGAAVTEAAAKAAPAAKRGAF